MLAHVAGVPAEEALMAAPALMAGVTVIVGSIRATAARSRRRTEGNAMEPQEIIEATRELTGDRS